MMEMDMGMVEMDVGMVEMDVGIVFWQVMYTVGWSAVQFLWQATLVGAAALLILRFALGGAVPEDRYRFLGTTLITLLILPVITAFSVLAAYGGLAPPNSVFLHATAINYLLPALGWIGLTCLLVAIVRLTKLFAHYARTRRLRSVDVYTTAILTAACDSACRLMAVKHPPLICISRRVDSPQIVGWRHPMILVPEYTAAALSPRQLEAIVMHELSHLERRDTWHNLAQCVLEAVLFHPLVGLLSTQLREQREYCCDRRVVGSGANRATYARALEKIVAGHARTKGLAVAAVGGSVLRRIEAVVFAVPPNRYRWPYMALGFLLLFGTTAFSVSHESLPIRVTSASSTPGVHRAWVVQVPFPDTPAGRAAREWFAAMATSSEDTLRAFFEESMYKGEQPYDPDEDLANHSMVLRDTGGLRPHSVLRSEDHQIVVLASGANGSWMRVTVGVEPEPPHDISTLGIRKSSGPASEEHAFVDVSPSLQREIARAAATRLRENYVYADVGSMYGDALEGIDGSSAQPMTAAAFATTVTTLLQSVRADQHLAVLDPARAQRVFEMYGEPEAYDEPEMESGDGPGPPDLGPDSERPEPEMEMHGPEMETHGSEMEMQGSVGGHGFGRVALLEGNLAYVEILSFVYGPAAVEKAREVMSSAQDATVIVFDVRSNGGGDGQMVELIESYLFAEPTHIMSSISRGGPMALRGRSEVWTTTNALSEKMASIPVFILTSRRTGSAAEAFAFGLKNMGRATLIGQTTAGAGHRVTYERLPGGFGLGLPVAAAVNPETGRGWDGVGVVPDLETETGTSLDALISMIREPGR